MPGAPGFRNRGHGPPGGASILLALIVLMTAHIASKSQQRRITLFRRPPPVEPIASQVHARYTSMAGTRTRSSMDRALDCGSKGLAFESPRVYQSSRGLSRGPFFMACNA